MAGLQQRNMNHLVTDLETVIWNKFGGNSTPPSSAYTVDKVTDGGPLQKAVLGQTVFYIASAVVVQEGRVLMMREAKRSCRGTWYLPAGRVEKDESLEEGVVREVREETGLDFQPTSIICIDSQEMNWFRFTFVGVITGGKLKTLQEQDSESLEAGWFTPKEVFSSLVLRAEDIRSLIDAGLKWYETKQKKSICRAMPVKKSHNGVIIRLVVVKTLQKVCGRVCCGRVCMWANSPVTALFCLLLNDKTANKPCPYFPYKVVSNSDRANLSTVIDRLMKEIDSGIAYKTHGYLNVEHTGKPWGDADGVCLTVLVEIFIPVEDGILNNKYNWFELKETGIIDKIWELMDCKGCVEIVQY